MSQNRIEKWDEVNGNASPSEKMEAFLGYEGDGYAILQLRRIPETVNEGFASMRMLERMGITPDISHYEIVYTAPLPPFSDRNTMLEELYTKFNIGRPSDFRGHSLSVSDIVVLKTGSDVSSHYVDPIGFTELPGFIRPDNHLKNAEMSMEDDYGMIDGIINNGTKQEPPAERTSVLEQLRQRPPQALAVPPTKKTHERDER